jgi:hypothetical protein
MLQASHRAKGTPATHVVPAGIKKFKKIIHTISVKTRYWSKNESQVRNADPLR